MRAALLTALLTLVGAALSGGASAQTKPAPEEPQGRAIVEDDLRVQAVPMYEGVYRQGSPAMVLIRIENLGEDAAGEIVSKPTNESGLTRYPVALPRGAKKAVPVAVHSYGGDAAVTIRTDRGAFEVPFTFRSVDARSSVLVVGDGSGGYAFLEQLQAPKRPAKTPKPSGYNAYEENRQFVGVAYARPEASPSGEADLDRTTCVVLTNGSERLNARQIAALRGYVLRGGHLVLFGGASAPVLADAPLRDLLPYSALRPGETTVAGRRISIQTPVPLPGLRLAEGGGIPLLRRDYGYGRVTLFGADPTEGALETMPVRTRLVASALDLVRSAQSARLPLDQGPDFPTTAVTPTIDGSGADPFSLNIPPTVSILYVLGAYFVVVLPANFLILRAMKRLELAWFTAPLLAVGFAAVLFRNAGSLYEAQLSHATTSTVYAASGGRDALALGRTSLFYPNANRGPIAIEGAEAIGVKLFQEGQYYNYYGDSSARSLDVTVTDRPSVPDYAASALEFRDLEFHQTLDLGRGVRVVGPASWTKGGRRQVRVTNDSPYTLRELRVTQGPRNDARLFTSAAPLAPGESVVLTKTSPVQDLGIGVSYRNAPVLVAAVDGEVAGPKIGRRVGGRSWTRLVVSGEME